MQYTYDVFNHLVAEVVYQNGTLSTTIANIYDGDNLLKQFTAAGTGSFSLTKRFLDGPAVDEVLGEEDMTQTFGTASRVLWYVDDNEGSTRELVDNSGNVVSQYNYTPYGQVLAGNIALTQALYSGGLYDPYTGLQYNSEGGGGRWYDPVAGRWITQDPIGIFGGDYNLGRYVGDDPTNGTDPSGLSVRDWVQGGLDAVGVFDPTPASDGLNAVIYAWNNEWGDAGISAVAMIPFFGDLAKGGKYGAKAVKAIAKHGDEAVDAAKQCAKVLDGLPGKIGKTGPIKQVPDAKALDNLFDSLSSGGKTVNPGTYPGVVKELPDGTIIRKRPGSKSGGATLDITLPDNTIVKVHITS